MSMIVNPFAFSMGEDPSAPYGVAGASMWIKADDPLLSGLSTNDPIGGTTPWTDLVTGTRTWTNPTSSFRPTYKENAQNGLPSILFDTTDDFLDFSVAGSNIFIASEFGGFLVVKPGINGSTLATEQGPNLLMNFGYIGISLFDSGGGTNKFRFYTYDGAYKGANSTTTYSVGSWYIVEYWYDGNVHLKVNNDTETSFDAGDPQLLTNIPRLSGNVATGSEYGESIVYPFSPSSGDRLTLWSALSSKWDI